MINWLEIFKELDFATDDVVHVGKVAEVNSDRETERIQKASFNLTIGQLKRFKSETYLLSDEEKLNYIESLGLQKPKRQSTINTTFNQTVFKFDCYYFDFISKYQDFLTSNLNREKLSIDYLAKLKEGIPIRNMEKLEKSATQMLKNRETYFLNDYNYSPTIEDFEEELSIQKENPSRFEFKLWLRETKKIYTNAKFYYLKWGANGGIDREPLYKRILDSIERELYSVKNESSVSAEQLQAHQNLNKIKKDKDKLWFKAGVLFANGEIDKLKIKHNNIVPRIVEEIGEEYNKYILATLNEYGKKGYNSNSDKNIYLHMGKMEKIILYCQNHNIEITDNFLKKFKELQLK